MFFQEPHQRSPSWMSKSCRTGCSLGKRIYTQISEFPCKPAFNCSNPHPEIQDPFAYSPLLEILTGPIGDRFLKKRVHVFYRQPQHGYQFFVHRLTLRVLITPQCPIQVVSTMFYGVMVKFFDAVNFLYIHREKHKQGRHRILKYASLA